jgi:hypothetical protein
MLRLPIYLNCQFFDVSSIKSDTYVYKVDQSGVALHPFQLFKLKDDSSGMWENLSVYATVDDAIMVLLKELITAELADEVNHGQATVNPAEIMEKINRGERSVSLYGSGQNEMFRLDFDVDFEDLIERK